MGCREGYPHQPLPTHTHIVILYLGMVYAMFSIGILGFLVWSHPVSTGLIKEQVALFCSNTEVINHAVCWNSSTLLGTFTCTNLSSYTKSAGHLNLIVINKSRTISSEIIRETSCQNFSAFRALYAKLGFSNSISDNWLSIGLAEPRPIPAGGPSMGGPATPSLVVCRIHGRRWRHSDL